MGMISNRSQVAARRLRPQLFTNLLSAAAFVFASLNIQSAAAIPIDEGASNFGHYNQNAFPRVCTDSAGNSYGCGVFAALNSFVFLQNKYPGLYMTSEGQPKLIPQNSAQDAAQNLAKDMSCSCAKPNTGVKINNFIKGKAEYINQLAPGTTQFEDQSIYDQNGKMTQAAPTFDFIYQQLGSGQDIELLLGFWQKGADGGWTRVGGHFVTLTGGDTNNLSFINPFFRPSDGSAPGPNSAYSMTTQITDMHFTFPGDGATDDLLQLTDFFKNLQGTTNHPDRNDNNTVTFVEAAVSESPIRPIPEPSSLSVFVIAAGAIFVWRRRLSRIRIRQMKPFSL